MNSEEVLQWFEKHAHAEHVITIPEDVFSSLDAQAALDIVQKHGAKTFIFLPEREQRFFEWLKQNDDVVWNDLWSEAEPDQAYVVSLAFLPLLLDPSRGFPICDLQSTDNYYFLPELMHTDEARDFIEAVKERFIAKESVTVAQLLALESSLTAVDIWHFAYHHSIELAQAKKAAHELVEEGILIHLKTAEELASFIN